MKQLYPGHADGWAKQAELAWQFLAKHAKKKPLCYQAYGCGIYGCDNNRSTDGPSRANIRVLLFSASTLNATGQSRVTLSLR